MIRARGGAAVANTLVAEIRSIVDRADRRLAQPEIRAQLKRVTTTGCFSVTVAYMLRARQLSRRRATRVIHAATGARYVYGPGPVPVEDFPHSADRPRKVLGFMEMRRMREAKARGRRLAA